MKSSNMGRTNSNGEGYTITISDSPVSLTLKHCDITVAHKKYLNVKEVAEWYGISTGQIWRAAKEGTIAQPIKLSAGVTRWRIEDLIEWDEKHFRHKSLA